MNILKNNSNGNPGDALQEAEKIILEYHKRLSALETIYCKRKRKSGFWLTAVIGLTASIGAAVFLLWRF